jgi:hypothetical protein
MKYLLSLIAMFALVVTPSFASKNSSTITFSKNVTIGATRLSSGQYKVIWNGSGPKVQVTLAKDGKAPVTLDAKLVEGPYQAKGVLVEDQGGVTILHEIHVGTVSLVFDNGQAAN